MHNFRFLLITAAKRKITNWNFELYLIIKIRVVNHEVKFLHIFHIITKVKGLLLTNLFKILDN